MSPGFDFGERSTVLGRDLFSVGSASVRPVERTREAA